MRRIRSAALSTVMLLCVACPEKALAEESSGSVAAAPDGGGAATGAPAPESKPASPEHPTPIVVGRGKPGPQVVTVGVYFYFVRSLDLRASSYTADFYIWFLWSGESNPTKSFEFMNALGPPSQRPIFVDEAGADKPQLLADGRMLQQYHVQGSFGHSFDLSHYPLDDQDIVIEIEDTKADAKDLVYQVDRDGSSFHESLTIPGWQVRNAKGVVRPTTYRTAFGDPRETVTSQSPNVTFSLRLGRPVTRTLLETLSPIFFTLLIAFCAFFTTPQELGTRLSMFAMAVMSIVFLHLAYVYDVAPGTISLVSELHIFCYLLLLTAGLLAVWSMVLAAARGAEAGQRFDRRCFIGLLCCLVIGTAGVLAFG